MEREPERFVIVQEFKDIWWLYFDAYDGWRLTQLIKGKIPDEYSKIHVISRKEQEPQLEMW